MQNNNRLKVVIALVTLYLSWSSTYLAIRISLEGFPPFFIAGSRYALVGAGMYWYLRWKGAAAPTGREWAGSALVGIFMLFGGTGGVVYAEQWVGSGIAALVLATSPLLTVLFARFWNHRAVRHEWIGMVLGLVGIFLLNMQGDLRAHPLGAVLLMLASASWAFGSAVSLRVTLPAGMMASAAQMFTGGLVVCIVSAVSGESVPVHPPARAVFAMLWLAVFGSLLGYTAYTFLLKNVRPALATSYAYVNPVLAVLLGVWLAGERITMTVGIAMPIILSGVVLVLAGQKRMQPLVEGDLQDAGRRRG